jgi:hypothetical protein
MPLPRQDLQTPNRESSAERRRRILENAVDPESLDDPTFATFLLEQEIQPTVNDEPRRTVKVRNV